MTDRPPPPRDDDPADFERLYASVRAEVERERGVRAWLRALPTPYRAAIVLVASGVAVAAPAVLMGGAPDGRWGWLMSVAGVTVVAIAATLLCLRPIHDDDAPSPAWLVALGAAALGSMVLASDGSLGAVATPACLMLGAMTGVPTLAVGLLVDRSPRRNVALWALAASLTGMTAAQLACPRRGLMHLVVDHFGALLVLAVVFAGVRLGLARLEDARRARR